MLAKGVKRTRQAIVRLDAAGRVCHRLCCILSGLSVARELDKRSAAVAEDGRAIRCVQAIGAQRIGVPINCLPEITRRGRTSSFMPFAPFSGVNCL